MGLFDVAWKEAIKNGITTCSLSMEQQSAQLRGFITKDAISNTDAIKAILGITKPNKVGGLDRTLPIGHPEFPWMFANSVSITGGRFLEKATSSAAFNEAPSLAYYATFSHYDYSINFAPRPYVLLKNSSIPVTGTLTWYDDNGVTKTTNNVPAEYYRYTDFEEIPAAEYLTAQQGQFKFERSDSQAPHNNTIPGQLRILRKTSAVKFRWYQVPYSFINSSNSFIKAGLGKINQFDWYGVGKGTLLFEAFTYKRYTPPNPGVYSGWGNGIISNEKLCDIEFTFLYSNPTTLTGGKAPNAPTNPNHITAGHNLLPWLSTGGNGEGYYYAAGGANVNYSPLYKSYPFELLFRDPDVA